VLGDEDSRKEYESCGEPRTGRSGVADKMIDQPSERYVHNNIAFSQSDTNPESHEEIENVLEDDTAWSATSDHMKGNKSARSADEAQLESSKARSETVSNPARWNQPLHSLFPDMMGQVEAIGMEEIGKVPLHNPYPDMTDPVGSEKIGKVHTDNPYPDMKGQVDAVGREKIGKVHTEYPYPDMQVDAVGREKIDQVHADNPYPDMKGQVEAIRRKKIGKVPVSNQRKSRAVERDQKSRSPFHPKNFRQQMYVEDDLSVEDSFFQQEEARRPSVRGKGGSTTRSTVGCQVCGGRGVTLQISRTRHGDFKMQQPCRACCLVSVASDDMINSVGFSRRMNNQGSKDHSQKSTKFATENLWPRHR
jgi:hypothetical protein